MTDVTPVYIYVCVWEWKILIKERGAESEKMGEWGNVVEAAKRKKGNVLQVMWCKGEWEGLEVSRFM